MFVLFSAVCPSSQTLSLISTLLRSHIQGEEYEGDELIDLESLEFVCPVCRRLANGLLPLLPRTATFALQQAATAKRATVLCIEQHVANVAKSLAARRADPQAPISVPKSQQHRDDIVKHFLARLDSVHNGVGLEVIGETASTLGFAVWCVVSVCLVWCVPTKLFCSLPVTLVSALETLVRGRASLQSWISGPNAGGMHALFFFLPP